MHYYLSHCYSIAWDRLQNHLRLLSACLSALLWSQFFFDSDEILHRSWGPKSKDAFVGVKIRCPFPYFAPNFFTPVMHFQWEGPNTAVTRPVTCLGNGYKYKVAKCYNPHFCPLKQKNGDQRIFSGNMLGLSV